MLAKAFVIDGFKEFERGPKLDLFYATMTEYEAGLPVKVNAVVYFRVVDPNRAIVEVENYLLAMSVFAGFYALYSGLAFILATASYAALGRTEAAKAAVADALKHHPDVTIEGFTGRPGFSEAERQRLVELMRAAGFPACAKAETLTRSPQLVRLPECHAK